MKEQATKMTDRDDPLEMSAVMLADMLSSFTEGDTGPDVGVVFKILEQVGRLGGWQDRELVCIARCLKDLVRRFFRSRDPKTFDEPIAIGAKEEHNEKVSWSHSLPVRYVEENTDVHEMHSRLDHLANLVESFSVRNKVKQNCSRSSSLILAGAITVAGLVTFGENATGINKESGIRRVAAAFTKARRGWEIRIRKPRRNSSS
ncbi:hypothetical protein HPB51_010412 [Rhipicephalus microplus]|uniref:Uncharacterized protein n=1 Tax=Rhipicephalus microplus TaxID=6941 RepID=A0A9J6E8F2_RHIMP|nr:hypothetical protein HPB51_010412 [Rhipicephalus microplus]